MLGPALAMERRPGSLGREGGREGFNRTAVRRGGGKRERREGGREGETYRVRPFEVFIFEFLPVDRLPARAVAIGEVSALDHEVLEGGGTEGGREGGTEGGRRW